MESAWPDGTQVALDVVRWCLAREGGSAAGPPPLPADAQDGVLDVIAQHRVTSLVAAHAADLGLDAQHGERLARARLRDVTGSLAMQAALLAVVGALEAVGVRCLTYKGAALAVSTTGDATARGAGDVDVLVASEDVPAAFDALVALGAAFVPGYCPPPSSDLWPIARRVDCEMPLRWRSVAIDLHWRIDRLPQLVSVPFDDLWAERAMVPVGYREVSTLGADDALLVTCAHGTKEHWRHWRWIVDVVRQSRQVTDWAALRTRARATGCERALAVGLAMHEHLAPLPDACPFAPGIGVRDLADGAWARACARRAPFGAVAFDAQLERLRWAARTLPSSRAAGSLLVRQGWSALDMAELPLPGQLAWAYPAVRPYLWGRRLATGRFGGAALTHEADRPG